MVMLIVIVESVWTQTVAVVVPDVITDVSRVSRVARNMLLLVTVMTGRHDGTHRHDELWTFVKCLLTVLLSGARLIPPAIEM